MKSSPKILVSVAVVSLVFLLGSLVILRKGLQANLAAGQNQSWESMAVKRFEGLYFSGNWVVLIAQGDEFNVGVAGDTGEAFRSMLEMQEQTLHFKTNESAPAGKKFFVKITAPFLKHISMEGGSKIQFDNFRSDSLKLFIKEGSAFEGKDNQVGFLFLKAGSDALYNFTDNEVMVVDLDVSSNANIHVKGNKIMGSITDRAKVFIVGEVEHLGVQIGEQASLIKEDPLSATLHE